MILIKRLDSSLKNPKEKYVTLFSQNANFNKKTDTLIQEKLSFSPDDWDVETLNAIKRLLGLPITKAIRYYKREGSNWSQFLVKQWKIVQEYNNWCIVQITVDELGVINIHHSYLSEMQSPTFVKDMEKQILSIT